MIPHPAELPCDALLFDLDGVLVDSTASVERLWTAWFDRHGLDAAALMPLVHGRRAIDTIRALAPALDADAEVAALVRDESEDTTGVVAMPGARRLLDALPSDAWAVVTSGARAVALARIRASGLPLPEVLVTADDVRNGKPDPEGYLAAARRLGAPPERCLVVEDAPAGAAAARAGGIPLIALATTHQAGALGAAALAVPSVSELLVTVGRDGARPRMRVGAAN